MPAVLLTAQDVAAALQLSPRQVWRMAASGTIPPPIRLGRATRWRAADVALFTELDGDMAAYTHVRNFGRRASRGRSSSS